jgi:hypothetical protein
MRESGPAPSRSWFLTRQKLRGLKDRAEALGGHLRLHSPAGTGTALEITLPSHDPGGPRLSPGARSAVPADLDAQPEGILWLRSYPADRWEQ